tara:strand:- start:16 stop:312 length:297 start_codon:yes stop_codon:yes gene_type:complete
MAEEVKMKEILKNLKEVVDRRTELKSQGKSFHPDTPKDLQVAIDTFFVHCENMIEYDLDFIPGEALADLCDVLVKYPQYHHIAQDLVLTLNTEYNMTI